MKNANKKITMDDLAAMVKLGFDETGEKFEEIKDEISGIKTEIGGLKTEIGGLKTEAGGLKKEMGGLKTKVENLREANAQEHQATRSRLDNVAHRFELVNLEKRVDILERKVDARRK